jgi:acetyl-CoA C-acetyltransferase
MPLDPRTPVLVGAAAVQQREEDPSRAVEPFALMATALEGAAEDAGSLTLLERADSIRVPRGFWDYRDPGRLVADRIGAGKARSVLAEIGVLQTTLMGEAAADIAAGACDVVLVTGGEAHDRAKRAKAAGKEPLITRQPENVAPDRVLAPTAEIVTELEIRCGVALPVGAYAMLENALRAADGIDIDTHRREVAKLWAAMSDVAAENPDAWFRERVSADAIHEAGDGNSMLAFPYTKRHVSQWHVDQAAGLIFCSLGTAQQLGIPRERWVFPLGIADSNHMTPFSQRRELHRSPGFSRAGERAFARAACSSDDIDHMELYSCFPAAVRVQSRELGIDPGRPLSVTGGMAFGGGPLNNFVLQAQAKMTQVLRADPGSLGLVTAVSGIINKQGVGLWSSEPRGEGFGYEDVGEEVAAIDTPIEVIAEADGAARVASYTVLHQGGKPVQGVLLCDLDDGRRALVTSADLAETMTREEICGRRVQLRGPRAVSLE